MTTPLDEATAAVRYDGERLSLYRAKVTSSRPWSPGRLAALERNLALSKGRLERARANARSGSAG